MKPKGKSSLVKVVLIIVGSVVALIAAFLLLVIIILSVLFFKHKNSQDNATKLTQEIIARGDSITIDPAVKDTPIVTTTDKSVVRYCVVGVALDIFPMSSTISMADKLGAKVYTGNGLRQTGQCYEDLVNTSPGEYTVNLSNENKEIYSVVVYQ
jgi:hypothetical protein